jgi:hypothetical protein
MLGSASAFGIAHQIAAAVKIDTAAVKSLIIPSSQ